jgi:hypothetical protein
VQQELLLRGRAAGLGCLHLAPFRSNLETFTLIEGHLVMKPPEISGQEAKINPSNKIKYKSYVGIYIFS